MTAHDLELGVEGILRDGVYHGVACGEVDSSGNLSTTYFSCISLNIHRLHQFA